MPFEDFTDAYDPDLHLPYAGRVYDVTVTARAGLWVTEFEEIAAMVRAGLEVSDAQRARLLLDDEAERSFVHLMLGPTYDEMKADGVPWQVVRLAAQTAYTYAAHGRTAAESVWNQGPQDRLGEPESPAKPKGRSGRRSSTSTGSTSSPKTTRSSRSASAPGASS